MRRGEVPYLAVLLILALVVFLFATPLAAKVFKGADRDIDALRSCHSSLPSLLGVQGKCFPNVDCMTPDGGGGTEANFLGSYWQRIGDAGGWGCPNNPEEAGDFEKHAPYCCIKRDWSENPLDVRKSTYARHCENQGEGALRLVTDKHCIPLDTSTQEAQLGRDDPFVLRYFTNQEGPCEITYEFPDIRVRDSFVETCESPHTTVGWGSVGAMHLMGDPAALNDVSNIKVGVKHNGKAIVGEVQILPGVDYCSSSSTQQRCVGLPIDSRVRKVERSRFGRKVMMENRCVDKGGYRCDVAEEWKIAGEISCLKVLDDKGKEITKDTVCTGVFIPSGTTCWKTRVPKIYTCTAESQALCVQESHGLDLNYGSSPKYNFEKCQ